MSQNTSHAVMAQRHEAHDSLDFFPTPPWATRALCGEVLWPSGVDHQKQTVWEPACGIGSMAKPLGEYFRRVYTSDINDYSAVFPQQERVTDFLFPYSQSACINAQGVNWIITNPPFRLGEQFVRRALDIAETGVAMLVRTAFLESAERYKLYQDHPPSIVAQFVERVPMVKGRLDRKASTATSYCWIVWKRGESDTRMRWIRPCRKDLDRDSDWA